MQLLTRKVTTDDVPVVLQRQVVCAAPSSAEITEQARGEFTTVMLRNIPNRCTHSVLLEGSSSRVSEDSTISYTCRWIFEMA